MLDKKLFKMFNPSNKPFKRCMHHLLPAFKHPDMWAVSSSSRFQRLTAGWSAICVFVLLKHQHLKYRWLFPVVCMDVTSAPPGLDLCVFRIRVWKSVGQEAAALRLALSTNPVHVTSTWPTWLHAWPHTHTHTLQAVPALSAPLFFHLRADESSETAAVAASERSHH